MVRISSFPPIAGGKPKALVLGTMPGKASLQKKEYYGHVYNQFWKLIYGIFGEKPDNEYKKKAAFLKSHGIALWDVVGECRRENSSLDTAIKEELPNDILGLLKRYPSIRHIFLDSRHAEKFFKKHFPGPFTQQIHLLPSPSPANARVSFEEKLGQWKKIRNVLEA